MPYLIESEEWRLLSTLGCLLQHRISPFSLPYRYGSEHERGPMLQLIEVELRRAFQLRDFPQNLEITEFEQCQSKLTDLCMLLNSLVATDRGSYHHPENLIYPHLRALILFLESTSFNVGLISGPSENIFKEPSGIVGLGECLRIITDYNDNFSRLLAPPPHTPNFPKRSNDWIRKRLDERNRATLIVNALFKHFTCETPHEILLKLPEDFHDNIELPTLQLIVSRCSKLGSWQEVRCDYPHINNTSTIPIPNICKELEKHNNQTKVLFLHYDGNSIFGAWEDSSPSVIPSSKVALHQLIMEGKFRPPSLDMLGGDSSAYFSQKDKRELAVKLGLCFMDYFDADLTPKTIYLLQSPNANDKQGSIYLAFNSKHPAIETPDEFGLGNPTSLSLAKLLLEIQYGKIVDLNISPDRTQNQTVWVKLLSFVERLEQEIQDHHLEAIRNCLCIHREIARRLRSLSPDNKRADYKILKQLYKKVVRPLELALAKDNPQREKRKRQKSPDSSQFQYKTQTLRPLLFQGDQKNNKDLISPSTQEAVINPPTQDRRIQPTEFGPPTDSGYASTHRVVIEANHKIGRSGEDTVEYVTKLVEQDIQDTQTEYSLQSSKTHSRQQIFISELATHIFDATMSFHTDSETLKQISNILPELLKAFSFKVGHHCSNETTEMHRDAMVFIHKYRDEISTFFSNKGVEQDEEDLDEGVVDSNSVNWESRIELLLPRIEAWNHEENEPEFRNSIPLIMDDQPPNVDSPQDVEAEVEAIDESWLVNWRDFILETDDFKWLIMRLRRQFELATTTPNAIGTIAARIMASLPSPRRITKKMPSPSYSVIFELE